MTREIWDKNLADLPWYKRWALDIVRSTIIVSRGFFEDQLLLRASALTYTTLLALVPFFALAFALLKGFGVQNQVEPWLLDQVAAGARETVAQIVQYVNNTDVRALGAVGLILLIFTAVSVITNVEKSLNTIWGVRTGRSWFRRYTDYLTIILVTPILLFAVLTVTTAAQGQVEAWTGWAEKIPVFGWFVETFATHLPSLGSILPYGLMWVFFTFLYLYLPNTHVRFKSALIAGLIAGVLWQLMQWGYIRFQIGVAKYNAIYGTLAQLPLLLIWFYFSWVVFLLGAEIAFAHQHLRTYAREREASGYSHGDREALAIRMMIEIARSFVSGKEAWTGEMLCEKLNAPLRLVNDTLHQLKEGGLLVTSLERQETRYLLARDLDGILIYDVVQVIRHHPGGGILRAKDQYVKGMTDRLEKFEEASLKNLNLRQALNEESKKS